jgi:outer membrane receptor protein involved in Fe transport
MITRTLYTATMVLLLHNISFSQYAFVDKDSIYHTTVRLKEVTVKSSKELHELKSLPASVSLVSESKLAGNEIFSLKDLSSFIPNLFMPDYGSRLTSPIYIRGIGSKIGSPSVGLYVDGVPYFEKACFDFEFSDIQSIEVLRGPQGTLYGRNTMGGIINIHTKSPENYSGGTVYASYGEYGYKKLGTSIYSKINDKLFFSINGNYNHKNGFFINKSTNKRPDEIDSYNGTAKLVYKKNDNFKSSLSITYQGSEQGGYPYGVLDKETMKIDTINYNRYSSYDRDLIAISLYNEYKTKNIIISSSTSYNYYDDHQAIDQDFKPADIYFVNHKQKQHMVSQEITFKSLKEKNYKWIFGAFGFYQLKKTTSNVDVYGTKGFSYIKYNDIPTIGTALFYQSTYNTGKLSFSLGVRMDYERAELDFSHYETRDATETKKDERKEYLEFFEFLPKTSIKYHINKRNFAYASIAKGYKTGGFNAIFEVPEHISYDPESSWNYEAGIKTSLFNNHLMMNLTGFYINWDNQQIGITVPSGRGRVQVNAGKSESKGIEFESTARFSDNLELQISYGLTNAKFIEYTDIKKDRKTNEEIIYDYSGKYIPYIPKQTIGTGISYKKEIKSNIIDAIKINALYKGFGEHYWDLDNKIKQSYYYTLDSKISFLRKNMSFEIWGKNLTNSDYVAYHFSSMGTDFAQAGKPSYCGASIKYTF